MNEQQTGIHSQEEVDEGVNLIFGLNKNPNWKMNTSMRRK